MNQGILELTHPKLCRHSLVKKKACQHEDACTELAGAMRVDAKVSQATSITRAQNKMKTQVDEHWTDRSFSVGDFVYLKAQSYVQTYLAPHSSNKLFFKY